MIDFKSEEYSSDMIDLSTAKRCVIYARCSTVFQEESIESQITFNQAFAKQKGITVVGIFQDEGKTGRKDDRDGLKALMTELQNPDRDWDLVLVYRIDRFFRNARLFMEYQYRMRDESVYLLSAQESMLNNIFPITDTFRFFVAQQAELESHRIGENVARGKITAAQKGRWQGGQPPLGYDVVDGTLIINPKEKQAVTMIFEQRAQGVSMQKIADILNEQGYLSKANRPFKPTGIREILINPCYKGEIHYNRSAAKGSKGFNRHSYKDDSQIIKTTCPAIVSKELWQKVQPLTENKIRISKSTRYLLSGKVFCKHCKDQVMHANRRNNHDKLYISFYCPNNKLHKGCTVKEIDMFKLEDFVLMTLCEQLLSKEYLKRFSDEFPKLNQKKKSELSELKTQHSRIEKRCNNLIMKLEDNCSEEVSKQITERLNRLSKEKLQLENMISALSKTMSYVPTDDDVVKAKSMFLTYCKQEENRPFVESLIRTNVEQIEVDNDSVTVLLNC